MDHLFNICHGPFVEYFYTGTISVILVLNRDRLIYIAIYFNSPMMQSKLATHFCLIVKISRKNFTLYFFFQPTFYFVLFVTCMLLWYTQKWNESKLLFLAFRPIMEKKITKIAIYFNFFGQLKHLTSHFSLIWLSFFYSDHFCNLLH